MFAQVAAVQTGAMQLSVDAFNSASQGQHQLKTDIQIKGVCVTKVRTVIVAAEASVGGGGGGW